MVDIEMTHKEKEYYSKLSDPEKNIYRMEPSDMFILTKYNDFYINKFIEVSKFNWYVSFMHSCYAASLSSENNQLIEEMSNHFEIRMLMGTASFDMSLTAADDAELIINMIATIKMHAFDDMLDTISAEDRESIFNGPTWVATEKPKEPRSSNIKLLD